jgi:hypothetical protein
MFTKRLFAKLPLAAVFLTAIGLAGVPAFLNAATIDEIMDAGGERADQAAADQRRVEQIANQTDEIVAEFTTVSKVVDGLKVYNNLLQRQTDNQVEEMNALRESIDNVSLIERQIVPLMTRMLDSLEEFVALDTPFLPQERSERIARLRAMMERSDVTAAEKFRRVLEAFSIENDYGRTIEAYKGSLEIEGGQREVDFLRIGRVSLTYQSVGGAYTGAWDNTTRSWVHDLPPETYKAQIAQGLRIARKQVAPDLLVIPVAAAGGVGQ